LVAAAVNAHRWGALALGLGLALSSAVMGIFIAALGISVGLDPDTFRKIGAVTLATFGLVLLVPKLQDVFARATGALGNSGHRLLARVTFGGLPASSPWAPCWASYGVRVWDPRWEPRRRWPAKAEISAKSAY
jgi:disulfide bond formation protein DsbB